MLAGVYSWCTPHHKYHKRMTCTFPESNWGPQYYEYCAITTMLKVHWRHHDFRMSYICLEIDETSSEHRCNQTGVLKTAGVLPFAKRGDDRGNNLVRLQQMFPRIVAADFEQPSHVTPECRHLLSRMLTADPNKRITIPEIMQHPWFQVSCWACGRSRAMRLCSSLSQYPTTCGCIPCLTQSPVAGQPAARHEPAELQPGPDAGACGPAERRGD